MVNVKSKTSKFWLDDVRCTGSELYLSQCGHIGWGRHNCGSSEAMKLLCCMLKKCNFSS